MLMDVIDDGHQIGKRLVVLRRGLNRNIVEKIGVDESFCQQRFGENLLAVGGTVYADVIFHFVDQFEQMVKLIAMQLHTEVEVLVIFKAAEHIKGVRGKAADLL